MRLKHSGWQRQELILLAPTASLTPGLDWRRWFRSRSSYDCRIHYLNLSNCSWRRWRLPWRRSTCPPTWWPSPTATAALTVVLSVGSPSLSSPMVWVWKINLHLFSFFVSAIEPRQMTRFEVRQWARQAYDMGIRLVVRWLIFSCITNCYPP